MTGDPKPRETDLECIVSWLRGAQLVGDRGDEPVPGNDRDRSGVEEQEASRAVRVLGLAGAQAAVPKERRLLVARTLEPDQRDPRAACIG